MENNMEIKVDSFIETFNTIKKNINGQLVIYQFVLLR